MAAGLVPAVGLVYHNSKRGVSVKVLSWMLTLILIVSNITFSCFDYKVDRYIAVNLLIAGSKENYNERASEIVYT